MYLDLLPSALGLCSHECVFKVWHSQALQCYNRWATCDTNNYYTNRCFSSLLFPSDSCMDAQKVFNELLDPEVAASVVSSDLHALLSRSVVSVVELQWCNCMLTQEVWPGKPASPQVGLALHSVKAVVQMMQYHFNQAQLQFLIEPKIDGAGH